MTKKKIILIILGGVLIGVFLFIRYVYFPRREAITQKAPVSLSKNDYRLEKKDNNMYLSIDKIGLSAKIPKGWIVKKKNYPNSPNEYWIEAYSPDFRMVKSLFKQGCYLIVNVYKWPQKATQISRIINDIPKNKNAEENKDEIRSIYYLVDSFKVIKIGAKNVLMVNSGYNGNLGKAVNFVTVLKNDNILSFSIVASPDEVKNQNKCLTNILNNFIDNLSLK